MMTGARPQTPRYSLANALPSLPGFRYRPTAIIISSAYIQKKYYLCTHTRLGGGMVDTRDLKSLGQ